MKLQVFSPLLISYIYLNKHKEPFSPIDLTLTAASSAQGIMGNRETQHRRVKDRLTVFEWIVCKRVRVESVDV